MNALRVIGTILMIAGVVAFAAALILGGRAGQPILFWGGVAGTAVGIILDSLGGGGIVVALRAVGVTSGPGQ